MKYKITLCKTVVLFSLFFSKLSFSQSTAGDALFGAAQVHDIYVNFTQTGWWDSLVANYTADIYMRAALVIDGVTYDTIGIKMKGNSSYNNPSKKKSFKIGIDEYVSGQKHDGLKKFNLNNQFKDPSFMREKLMCDFANQMGANCPRCTYTRVYLNNVYWGLYNIVEEIDKTYLGKNFTDKKGNLFKGDPNGDLKWINSTPSSYYTKYELKTNETQNNWSDLVHLIDKINNTVSTSFHDSMESVIRTTSVLKSWALTNIFVNLDSYLGSGHNYYIYDDSTNFKFHYILWDINEAFGNFNMGMSVTTLQNLSMYYLSNPTNRPLYNKMLANTQYKADLTTQYCNMVPYFSNALLDPKIDSIKNLIMTDVQNDTMKFYSYNDFLNNINSNVTVPQGMGTFTVPGIKSFIAARNTALVNELATQGCFVGITENVSGGSVMLFPNPSNGNSVKVVSKEEIRSIEVFNAAGSKITEVKDTGRTEYSLETSSLAGGVYFIKLNGLAVKKLVISK